jgi:hypothetical protein
MPKLGNALDFAQLEALNIRVHQAGSPPVSPTPVKGQLYFNNVGNELYYYDGTGWQTAKGGVTGTAGGDLSGTYPNPQIAAGAIVDADVNAAAAIAKTKLAALNIVNADVAAGAAIVYAKLSLTNSILNGDLAGSIALSKLATDPLARANHTGTQLAATISDFNTARDLQRLDQHVAPTAAVNLNNQRIIGVGAPSADTDGATKGYVDATAQGLVAKQSCRMASIGPMTVPGVTTSYSVDGKALASGDRVLLKDQASPAQNGIYTWQNGVGLLRANDFDSYQEIASAYVWINEGTVNQDTGWVCTTDVTGGFVLDTTAITWVQFASAGAAIAGAGLTKTGNTLDVGAAAGITVAADTVGVATGGVTNAMLAGAIDATTKLTGAVPIANGGTSQTTAKASRETGLGAAGYYSGLLPGTAAAQTITAATHGLRASRGLLVQVQDEAVAGGTPGAVVLPDIVVAANGDVTITFAAAVVANAYRVTIIG